MRPRSTPPAPSRRVDLRVECPVAGPWRRDVVLIRDAAGRAFVRLDGTVYDRGRWASLPVDSAADLGRALRDADRRLAAQMAERRRAAGAARAPDDRPTLHELHGQLV